ncbi:MAG: MFS transporter, partial [Kiloniellales bacterium]|nr:MFS transporter [Kiloniellales bacterium]
LRSRGMSAAAAGYWAAVPTAIGILGALVIPRLATPERRLAILLALFLSAAGATLLLQLGPGLGLVSGLFLQGLARSSMMTLAILTLVEIPEVGSRHAGSAGGLFFSAAEIGGVLGPLSVGIVFDASGGFGAALVMMTGVCALLVLLLAGLRRHH